MINFKDLIGYDLHVSTVAFEHQGSEIVFIQDFFVLKRRIYIDGEQVFSEFSNCLGFMTDADFSHQGKHYRIVSRTVNYLSMKQDVTLWVDGVEAGRKIDPFYASLPISEKIHAALGVLGFGALIGFIVGTFF